jgi:hypothetical protein
MAKNVTLYWSLTQAIVFAQTSDFALVAEIPNFRDLRQFDVRVAVSQAQAKSNGRDINVELWQASGGNPIQFDTVEGFESIEVVEPWAAGYQVRPSRFKIEEHFEKLLRTGKLRSQGRRPGKIKYRALSAVDWNDLKIERQDHGDHVWVALERTGKTSGLTPKQFLLIQIPQADVLRQFPAPRMIDEQIKAFLVATQKKEGRLTLTKARKIVPQNVPLGYQQPIRENIDRQWRALNPGAEPGRPKKQKN